ncbi:zinc metallopeptidase [Desertibacillus haloalkaliphilus]|uniref:zinc metallopeptidase n=1 Tax=Desertibacillus haloalkaliphilus TaxID=1328930 RepID=UPI001C27A729|nr:zinc metallopeptidase [Desertibacillus haloalkaliphilus]MBU8907267.1 zinc metallopeptidase [Desertibacillus haloalkaliphilus]
MSLGAFIVYFVLLLIIPIWAQSRVKSAYRKYSQVPSSSGMTGAQVARKILDDNGLFNVAVEEVRGQLTDHYDPRSKVVRLSTDNYHGHSVAGAAVAAHEVGHAIQDAEDYAFLRFRHALVPLANFGSNFSFFLILAGIIFSMSGALLLGIIFMSFAVLFQLVTLPVEFDASNRAMQQVVSVGVIRNDEERETRKVLNAAALTYVAAALVALLELVRFILMYIGMNDD